MDKSTGAYFGIKNTKYCIRDEEGTRGTEVKELGKSKTLSLNPLFNKQEVYADDEVVVSVPSDKGYDGSYGCTGQNTEFEKAIGQLTALGENIGGVEVVDLQRFDMYYEHTVKPVKGKSYVVKTWLLNMEANKPSIQNDTNTENLTIGQYQYPIKVYGDRVMTNDGTKVYTDERGFEKKCFLIRSVPGDSNYETFAESVPEPKAAS